MELRTDIEFPIEVLRIGTSPREFEFLKSCPRVAYKDLEIRADYEATRKTESGLEHAPDLYRFKDGINLERRRLAHLVDHVSVGLREEYYIYKCVEARGVGQPRGMKLPKNRCLEETNAYGDVFVFKIDPHLPVGRDGKANFGSMKDFARSLDRLYAKPELRESMTIDHLWERRLRTWITREDLERESLVNDKVLRRLLLL